MLSEEEFMDAQDAYGMDAFTANIGAEAIREMLQNIDLEAEAEQLRADLAEATGELKPKKIIKRLKVVESFLESGNRPEWMVMTVIRSSRRNCARWCRWMGAGSRRQTSTTFTVV